MFVCKSLVLYRKSENVIVCIDRNITIRKEMIIRKVQFKLQWNIENKDMIGIRYLKINELSALNKPEGVYLPINK